MLTVDETEQTMHEDPTVFGHVLTCALQQPEIIALIAQQVQQRFACDCQQCTVVTATAVTNAINAYIRDRAENSVQMVAAVMALREKQDPDIKVH